MVLAIFLSYVACYLPITIVKVADDEVVYPGEWREKKICQPLTGRTRIKITKIFQTSGTFFFIFCKSSLFSTETD